MEDTIVKLHIHHGGVIVPNIKTFKYEGGSCMSLYPFDIDKFGYFELKGYAKEFGYVNNVDFYYLKPGVNFDIGLYKIETDDDARLCIERFVGLTNISVFCVHGITEPHILEPTAPLLGKAMVVQEAKLEISEDTRRARKKGKRKVVHEDKRRAKKKGKRKIVHEVEVTISEDKMRARKKGKKKVAKETDVRISEVESEDSDETDREDVDTTDDEWVAAYNTVQAYKQERVADRGRNANVGRPETSYGDPFDGYEFVSEYETSEGEMDPIVNSDEESIKKKNTLKVDGRTDFKTFKWELSILFRTAEQFKEAVIMYGLNQGYSLKFVCADTKLKKYKVVCVKGCPFTVYASWDKPKWSYVVKKVNNDHTCTRDMNKNRLLKAGWCAQHYITTFRDRPHWSGKDIILAIKKEFGILIKKWQAYHIRHHASKLLHGSMKDHYAKFGSYIEELKRSNNTSIFILYTHTPERVRQPVPIFQRFFVCFEGLRKGLLTGCRRVLVIDAAFLKTFLGGTILSAIGVDGNNQMFPLAWAVAEGENNDSWDWFLTNIKQAIETRDGGGWTIISDQHRAIHHGVATVLPASEHRNCARHIYANWHKQHKGEDMKFKFWDCALSYNKNDFLQKLEFLRAASRTAAEDFIAQNPRTFCRAYMNTNTKCQYVVSNMAETFNAYIVRARSKHVLFMLEDIRMALMERICLKKSVMEKATDNVCPRIRKG